MERQYKVIEDRGCGIRYEIKTGTWDECWDKKEEMDLNPEVNGNGDPFTYVVVDAEEDINYSNWTKYQER